MTLNEWFLSLPEGRKKVLIEDKWLLAEAAWNAAKEDSKPSVKIVFDDVWYYTNCDGLFGMFFETKGAAEKWAIENGYRIEER